MQAYDHVTRLTHNIINQGYFIMLKNIIKQVQREHSWDDKYAKEVAEEYCKFLRIRLKDIQLSPSDDIDKFWHQHILNTANYYQFCEKYFRKFIHHYPEDAYNQEGRMNRLNKTVFVYEKTFGKIKNPKIWLPYTGNISDERRTVRLPNDTTDFIKIDVYRNFLTRTGERPFVGKPLKISIGHNKSCTIDYLRTVVADEYSHQKIAVKFYEKPDMKKSYDDELRLLKFPKDKVIYCLLDDVTSGYC